MSNEFTSALVAGEAQMAGFILVTAGPGAAEIAPPAGYDRLWIDGKHGARSNGGGQGPNYRSYANDRAGSSHLPGGRGRVDSFRAQGVVMASADNDTALFVQGAAKPVGWRAGLVTLRIRCNKANVINSKRTP